MPSALIWGGLKAVLEVKHSIPEGSYIIFAYPTLFQCIQRHYSVADKIHQHLKSLSDEVRRLSQYESLFKESVEMQKLLVSSYVNIIRFWAKVDDELSKNSFRRAGKALSGSAIKSLDSIIGDILDDGKSIDKWIHIITESRRRNEHHDIQGQSEKMAGDVRELLRRSDEERKERKGQQKLTSYCRAHCTNDDRLEATHELHINERRCAVRKWIRGEKDPSQGNRTRQRFLERKLTPGTGDWILTHPRFTAWTSDKSVSNTLLVNGGPGVGKSVLCAHMVTSIQHREPAATVAYYYHRMDDPESSLDVCRNLAEQCAEQLFMDGGNISDKAFDFIHGPCNEDTIWGFVSTLIGSLEKTYIFIDGVDETIDDKKRMEDACESLSTLHEFADEAFSTLKIWCSSIGLPRVQESLKGAAVVVQDASTNSHDIETFFAREVSDVPIFAELDPAEREDCLQDIKQQVQGNFLWASMMVETIGKDFSLTNLDDVQQMVRNGLPGDFEDYLQKRTRSLQHESSNIPR